MNINKLLVVVVLSVLFVACTGNQRQGAPVKTFFVTDIDEQGSKRFHYSVIATKPEKNKSQRNTKQGKGGRGGDPSMRGGGRGARAAKQDNITDKIKSRMTLELQIKLEETGYCREGYLELDSDFNRGRSYIRGECKEGANTQDKQDFGSDHTGYKS